MYFVSLDGKYHGAVTCFVQTLPDPHDHEGQAWCEPFWQVQHSRIYHWETSKTKYKFKYKILGHMKIHVRLKLYLDVMKVSCLCLPSRKPFVALVWPGEDGSDRKERSNSAFRSSSGQHSCAKATRSTLTCNTGKRSTRMCESSFVCKMKKGKSLFIFRKNNKLWGLFYVFKSKDMLLLQRWP